MVFIVYPRYYGIEAAYKTIVREVTNVFGVYGIEVDYRWEYSTVLYSREVCSIDVL